MIEEGRGIVDRRFVTSKDCERSQAIDPFSPDFERRVTSQPDLIARRAVSSPR